MMEELLVILACNSGKGCDQTAKAYYQTHESVRNIAESVEKKGKKILGPLVIEYVIPVSSFLSGQSVQVRITNNISLKINKNVADIAYSKEF